MTLRLYLCCVVVVLAGALGWSAARANVPCWGDRESQSVETAATALKPGQWVWSPGAAPKGPILVVVNLDQQRGYAYRNGILIGSTSVSTGKKGFQTPTGVFHTLPQRELLVENAYIIPSQPHIDWLRTLTQRGVTVGIVANSLASHDVPAVNSHYKKWRKPLLEAGVSLFEIRHDAAVQRELADTAPVRSGFMGLHVKAIAVDGKRVMIGSMNLDPRSADINSEMAVIVDSPRLAADVVALIRRDMQPENSWRVQLDDQGRLRWVQSDQTVTLQPARNAWQRVEDIIFMAFPREYY